METWQDRLQLALDVRGKGWSDLVSLTKAAKSSVHGWNPRASSETASKSMDGKNAALVCDDLRINPMWLFFGKGPSGLEPQTQTAEETHAEYLSRTDRERLLSAWEKLSDTPKQAVLTLVEHMAEKQQRHTTKRRKPGQPITLNQDAAQHNEEVARRTGDLPSADEKIA